MNNLCNFCFSR